MRYVIRDRPSETCKKKSTVNRQTGSCDDTRRTSRKRRGGTRVGRRSLPTSTAVEQDQAYPAGIIDEADIPPWQGRGAKPGLPPWQSGNSVAVHRIPRPDGRWRRPGAARRVIAAKAWNEFVFQITRDEFLSSCFEDFGPANLVKRHLTGTDTSAGRAGSPASNPSRSISLRSERGLDARRIALSGSSRKRPGAKPPRAGVCCRQQQPDKPERPGKNAAGRN